MVITYELTPELRIKLKAPIGMLIRGSFAKTMEIFKTIVEKEKPTLVISVGDTVSKNLVKNHIHPQMLIIDNKAMRKKIKPTPLTADKTVYIKNPPGTITEEAIETIKNSLKTNCYIKAVVDGEEDLLTLIAVLYAPENAFVVYGQPYEGIVVIKVTPKKKAEIAEILKTMETARKAK